MQRNKCQKSGETQSSMVSMSVRTIRLSTALMLPVLCLFARCLSGPGGMTTTAAANIKLHKHARAHNLKISRMWFGLSNAAGRTFYFYENDFLF